MNTLTKKERTLGGLWGSLVGDALGVPVEFQNRAAVQAEPVTGMRGYGTHGQPAGTWSDDSSMLLCTVESLVEHEFSANDLAQRFVRWGYHAHWTPHGVVFDRGIATSQALHRIFSGVPALECGGRGERDNGNGSLMRILPVCLRFAGSGDDVLISRVRNASCVTHAHERSQLACVFHALVVRALLQGQPPADACDAAAENFRSHFERHQELTAFGKVLQKDLGAVPEPQIGSGGYVMDTLTASLWCLLTTDNFHDCIFKAVNLGGDTDTTGCVAGGLAGVCYGLEAIPREWRTALARAEEVEVLFNQFTGSSTPARRPRSGSLSVGDGW